MVTFDTMQEGVFVVSEGEVPGELSLAGVGLFDLKNTDLTENQKEFTKKVVPAFKSYWHAGIVENVCYSFTLNIHIT